MFQAIKEITQLNIPDQKKIEIINLLINSSSINRYEDSPIPIVPRQRFLNIIYSKYNLDNLSLGQARDYINLNMKEISKKYNVKPEALLSRSTIDTYRRSKRSK